MVMEKSRDIAILKTMGATSRSISIVFMLQGTLIGVVGTAAGLVLGLGLSFVLDRYRLVHIPGDVYQIAYMPFRIEPLDVAVVVVRGAGHLLPRDDLPVAPGGAPRSGGGAASWLTGHG